MDCVNVTPECPVTESIYGYFPNYAANIFFSAFFGFFMLVNIFLGIRYRAWTFLIALSFGCLGEAIGYAGRILLHNNPFDEAGFNIQICCLTLAPAFLAAGIYLTLKHIVICFGEEHSFLKPKYYTWIFITCDVFSLILQGAGGGIAATSIKKPELQQVGNNLMMAGISFQVVTLFAFAVMAGIYWYRLSRSESGALPSSQVVGKSTTFRLFLAGFGLAYTTIFIRCIYRIAEMEAGWASPLMQSEREFIVLDSVMIMIATLSMTVFHPGYCFPQMVTQARRERKGDVEKTVSDSSIDERESR